MNLIHEADFEAFVTRSGDKLFRTAMFLAGGNPEAAEDLLQGTLERVFGKWKGLEGSPEAYARVVMANLTIDRWRRRRARPPETTGLAEAEFASPGDLAVEVAGHQALLSVLCRLPPRERTVLVLRYFEDQSERETAAILGISVGTVKSSASRGLARLRLELKSRQNFEYNAAAGEHHDGD